MLKRDGLPDRRHSHRVHSPLCKKCYFGRSLEAWAQETQVNSFVHANTFSDQVCRQTLTPIRIVSCAQIRKARPQLSAIDATWIFSDQWILCCEIHVIANQHDITG